MIRWREILSTFRRRRRSSWPGYLRVRRFDSGATRRLSLAAVAVLLYFIGACPSLSSQNANEGFYHGDNSSRNTNPKTEKCKIPATEDSPAKIVNGPCADPSQKCDPNDPECKQAATGASDTGSNSAAGSGLGGGGGNGGSSGTAGGASGSGGSPSPPAQPTRLLFLVEAAWLHWPGNHQPVWKPGLGALGVSWGNVIQVLSASVASVQSASPSTAYSEIALPAPQPAVAPATASDVARAGFVAVNAIASEAADVNAFATNYSRYLGARQKGDSQAMLQLAKALVQLSDRAGQDGNAAASATGRFDQMLAPIIREVLGRMRNQGSTWDEDIKRMKIKAPQGLPNDTENEILATGTTPDQLASLEAAVKSLSATQLKSAMEAFADPNAAAATNDRVPQQAAIGDLKRLATRLQTEAERAVGASTAAATSSDASAATTSPGISKSDRKLPKAIFLVVGLLVGVGAGSFLIGMRGAKLRRGATPKASSY